MEALRYRTTGWICGKLNKETLMPNQACYRVPLLVFIMKRNQM